MMKNLCDENGQYQEFLADGTKRTYDFAMDRMIIEYPNNSSIILNDNGKLVEEILPDKSIKKYNPNNGKLDIELLSNGTKRYYSNGMLIQENYPDGAKLFLDYDYRYIKKEYPNGESVVYTDDGK